MSPSIGPDSSVSLPRLLLFGTAPRGSRAMGFLRTSLHDAMEPPRELETHPAPSVSFGLKPKHGPPYQAAQDAGFHGNRHDSARDIASAVPRRPTRRPFSVWDAVVGT